MENKSINSTKECCVCQSETQLNDFKGKKVCSACIQEIKTK
jgi:hypothetical protein